MAINALILDLDGTLVDSLADIAASVNAVLATYGHPAHSLDAYRSMIGDGVGALVERALGPNPPAPLDDVVRAVRVHYDDHMFDRTAPFPGVADALTELSRRGVPLAVLSNKPHAKTVRMVERLLGDFNFTSVLGDRDGVPRKPDPVGALEAARAANVPAEECAMIGDSDVDIQTGLAAGMTAVGVAWGFRGADELRRTGAHRILDTPADLVGLVTLYGSP